MKKEEMAISESKTWPADAGGASAGEWLDGTVVMVEPSRELLFVRANATRQKVGIHWAAGTQFVLRGQPASSAVLRIGQRLHIHCRLAPQVPVIVITARPDQARRAADAGIDMLLEKPLDIPVLLETIRELLAAPGRSRFAQTLRAWHALSAECGLRDAE